MKNEILSVTFAALGISSLQAGVLILSGLASIISITLGVLALYDRFKK